MAIEKETDQSGLGLVPLCVLSVCTPVGNASLFRLDSVQRVASALFPRRPDPCRGEFYFDKMLSEHFDHIQALYPSVMLLDNCHVLISPC